MRWWTFTLGKTLANTRHCKGSPGHDIQNIHHNGMKMGVYVQYVVAHEQISELNFLLRVRCNLNHELTELARALHVLEQTIDSVQVRQTTDCP